MLTSLLLLFSFASSRHEQVVLEYNRKQTDEVAVGAIDTNLEEAEPTLKEYDGALSFPFGANEASVGADATSPTQCSENGIFCKCGFQDVSWIFHELDRNQDCYTLRGVCQHCGLQDRVREIGFDYKFLPPQHEDVYRLRILKENEIWNPPRYNYKCKDGYVVTGVRSKYLRVEKLGSRDFYTLKIKCGKLKGEDDPNLQPADWQLGKRPWAMSGEKPECEDLEETKCKKSTECAWKANTHKCENGNPFALEALIAEAKNKPGVEQALESILKVENVERKADSTKPQVWDGKSGSTRRELSQEEPAASIDELDLGADFHPHLKDVLSEFSQFVQAPSESTVGDEETAELDPFLINVLEQFGDSLMGVGESHQQPVGDSDVKHDSLEDLFNALEYYDLDSENAVSSDEDLHPVEVGDEFFNIDSDDIISGFLREETQIERALQPHHRQNLEGLDEVSVGDAISLEELEKQDFDALTSLATGGSQLMGFGIFAPLLSLGKVGVEKLQLWKHLSEWFFGLSTIQLVLVGLFFFIVGCMAVRILFRKSGDKIRTDYKFLQSEDEELEF